MIAHGPGESCPFVRSCRSAEAHAVADRTSRQKKTCWPREWNASIWPVKGISAPGKIRLCSSTGFTVLKRFGIARLPRSKRSRGRRASDGQISRKRVTRPVMLVRQTSLHPVPFTTGGTNFPPETLPGPNALPHFDSATRTIRASTKKSVAPLCNSCGRSVGGCLRTGEGKNAKGSVGRRSAA